ncbi:MAG: hypothetical protein ACI377_09395, partial [Bacteroides fragilis]
LFFLIKASKKDNYQLENKEIKNLPPNLKKNPKNDFRSSIFHLSGCMLLITRCLSWWKMLF